MPSRKISEAAPKTLYMPDRDAWRAWLSAHHDTETEVWLIYYKKHTRTPSIPYSHAVEEALCFGWIDSIVRKIDDARYMQKFTPRKSKSIWAQSNKDRVEKLIRKKMMTPAGMAKVKEAQKNGSWDSLKALEDTSLIPDDLERALASQPSALEIFRALSASRKKQFLWWIESAKRPETKNKRIQETVRLTIQGKQPGTQ